MEKGDKGSTLIRMGVSGWMFLLVPAYLGCPGSKAVKRSLFLLVLRSQNQRMECLWVCCRQLWVWCSFNIPWLDSFLVPPVFREMGKLLQILPKIWLYPRLASCCNQLAERVKMEKYFFLKRDDRSTLSWKYKSLPLPVGATEWPTACYGVSHSSSPLVVYVSKVCHQTF